MGFGALGANLAVHSDIVTPYIAHLGTEEQKKKYLPKLVTGEIVGAIAMTEPGAGSDLQGIKTTAVKNGAGYVINGSKTFITNGQHADVVITFTKTDPKAGAKGTTLFLVDADTPGFSLALTLDYVRNRKAFGQPIASFQNTRFELAQIKTDIEVTKAFIQKCAALYAQGKLDVPTAAMAKLAATETQFRVADRCLQLFGGYGYMTEYPISRYFADARVQRIYGGTSEIMKEVIARSLVGR